MAINATFVLPDFAPRIPEYVEYIVSPLFDSVFMFVILVLLFVVGIRKQKGVWSTQGWQNGGQIGMGYSHGQQPMYYYPPQQGMGMGMAPPGQSMGGYPGYGYPQPPQPVQQQGIPVQQAQYPVQQQGIPVQQVQHPVQDIKAVST